MLDVLRGGVPSPHTDGYGFESEGSPASTNGATGRGGAAAVHGASGITSAVRKAARWPPAPRQPLGRPNHRHALRGAYAGRYALPGTSHSRQTPMSDARWPLHRADNGRRAGAEPPSAMEARAVLRGDAGGDAATASRGPRTARGAAVVSSEHLHQGACADSSSAHLRRWLSDGPRLFIEEAICSSTFVTVHGVHPRHRLGR
jgi:hypothetical protein